MMESKNLIDAMKEEKTTTGALGTLQKTAQKKQTLWCKSCKEWVYHSNDKCLALEIDGDKCPQWNIEKMENLNKE